MRKRWTKEDYDNLQQLVATGRTTAAALRQLGIPKGSLGNLRRRFGPLQNGASEVLGGESQLSQLSQHEPANQSIGELAEVLNEFTENMLDLTTQMSELTRHAHGLAVLDTTLEKLEVQIRESSGLRRRLKDAESQLIVRASVVHSND